MTYLGLLLPPAFLAMTGGADINQPGAAPGACRPPGVDTELGVRTLRAWVSSDRPASHDLLAGYGLAGVAPGDVAVDSTSARCARALLAIDTLERATGRPAPVDRTVWLFRLGSHVAVDWVHACDSHARPVAVFDSAWHFRGYLGVPVGGSHRPCGPSPSRLPPAKPRHNDSLKLTNARNDPRHPQLQPRAFAA